MAEKKKTIRQFILELLEDTKKPLHIQDFVDAFEQAGYESTRESLRGRINELTYAQSISRLGNGWYIKKQNTRTSDNTQLKHQTDKDFAVSEMENWLLKNYVLDLHRRGPRTGEILNNKFEGMYEAGWINEAIRIFDDDELFFWKKDPSTEAPVPPDNKIAIASYPKQELGANVTFVDGKITATTLHPEKENPNRKILEQLYADLINKSEVSARLITPTDNRYPNLGQSVSQYLLKVNGELDNLNLTTVFIKGADLKAEFETIESAISEDKYDEYPELPQKVRSAIRKQLEAHARFVGLSEEGGILLDAFAKANRTPQQEREYRSAIAELGKALEEDPDFIAPELAQTVSTLSNTSSTDPNQKSKIEIAGRYSRHILILTGTVATFGLAAGGIVGGIATANPLVFAGGLAAAAFEFTLVEAYKKSDANKELSGAFTKGMNMLSSGDIALFNKAMSFLRKAKEEIQSVAKENAMDEWFRDIHNKDEKALKDWTDSNFYVSELQEYAESLDLHALFGIIDYLMPALQNRDVSLVACSDTHERDRIAADFGAKKLNLKLNDAVKQVNKICQTLQPLRHKHRVTFYYLMAEKANKLSLFHSERF